MIGKFIFNCFSSIVFPLLLIIFISGINFAQINTSSQFKDVALKAFAGEDLSKKDGPLVKAGYDLALLVEEFKNHQASRSMRPFEPSNSQLTILDEKVIVSVIAIGDPHELVEDLKVHGMKITGISGSVISGYLPVNSIENTAEMEKVNFIRPSYFSTSMGLCSGQGDCAMRSDYVRNTYGYDGTGVTVGILSDSYNYLGTAVNDVLSGDLPGSGNPNGHTDTVLVLEDNGVTDEGRAMLQIVHDVAPGAKLAFATAFNGEASFANNITELHSVAGADVIVDDVYYYSEPMFQDGIIAQAVDSVVSAGTAYFSSAGNNANRSYESDWRNGQVRSQGSINCASGVVFWGGTTFDFDPGPGVDDLQRFVLKPNSDTRIILQWDSPFASVCEDCPGSSNDLDYYLLNEAGDYVYVSSSSDNLNGDAQEYVRITYSGSTDLAVNLMIVKYSGPDPGFIKYINTRNSQKDIEYATNSSTIFGHANSNGAEAVAAAAYYNTPEFGVNPAVLESFSSYGSTAIRFTTDGTPTYDARADKPEITAPDGVNTTFFGGSDWEGDGYPNFYGTSAASPHAGAVAALIIQADNSLTPSEIYEQMECGACDMGDNGFDNTCGYGLIQADQIEALPVELTYFEGHNTEEGVVLNWETATEINNFGFEIERKNRRNGEWENIGFMQGHGTTNSPKNYEFTDSELPDVDAASYRLKQIDNDGTFAYSKTVAVDLTTITSVDNEEIPTVYSLDQNYPNPFNLTTKIKFGLPESGLVDLRVYNILGEEIVRLVNAELNAGYHEVQFDASSLASGMYFYRIDVGNDFSSIKKMSLLK